MWHVQHFFWFKSIWQFDALDIFWARLQVFKYEECIVKWSVKTKPSCFIERQGSLLETLPGALAPERFGSFSAVVQSASTEQPRADAGKNRRGKKQIKWERYCMMIWYNQSGKNIRLPAEAKNFSNPTGFEFNDVKSCWQFHVYFDWAPRLSLRPQAIFKPAAGFQQLGSRISRSSQQYKWHLSHVFHLTIAKMSGILVQTIRLFEFPKSRLC